jgi:flagellar motor switch/type III secretory pathway protein FliN
MASVSASPAPQAAQTHAPPSLAAGTDAEVSQALVPALRLRKEDEVQTFSPQILALPVEADVAVPIRDFRVRHLLALAPGQVVESQWVNGSDLPLAAGSVQLAWTEFEVVETKLAVRVTRVA